MKKLYIKPEQAVREMRPCQIYNVSAGSYDKTLGVKSGEKKGDFSEEWFN